MPWFAWFLLGALFGGSIGCLLAAMTFAAREVPSTQWSKQEIARWLEDGTMPEGWL